MFEKSGKYYADWRDKSGRRLRKSFTSKAAALQFEADQKELAHPKTAARGQQSPKILRAKLDGCRLASYARRLRPIFLNVSTRCDGHWANPSTPTAGRYILSIHS